VSPRVALGGMAIESSTFSPHRSRAADFTVVRGSALLAKYDTLPSTVEWIPLVHARALPGGAVERAFYDSIKTELLDGLRAALPLDGVYLDIHGAMTVVGMIDAEGDLAAAIREVVGRDCLISASMDPHGNMSRRLIGALDLATSHRMSSARPCGGSAATMSKPAGSYRRSFSTMAMCRSRKLCSSFYETVYASRGRNDPANPKSAVPAPCWSMADP